MTDEEICRQIEYLNFEDKLEEKSAKIIIKNSTDKEIILADSARNWFITLINREGQKYVRI